MPRKKHYRPVPNSIPIKDGHTPEEYLRKRGIPIKTPEQMGWSIGDDVDEELGFKHKKRGHQRTSDGGTSQS